MSGHTGNPIFGSEEKKEQEKKEDKPKSEKKEAEKKDKPASKKEGEKKEEAKKEEEKKDGEKKESKKRAPKKEESKKEAPKKEESKTNPTMATAIWLQRAVTGLINWADTILVMCNGPRDPVQMERIRARFNTVVQTFTTQEQEIITLRRNAEDKDRRIAELEVEVEQLRADRIAMAAGTAGVLNRIDLVN
uniref:Uncharacterized protein n=1 Tax=Panagrolaimus sp. JU765 TaxID=591449 RepID=A0AC34R432_9BILA